MPSSCIRGTASYRLFRWINTNISCLHSSRGKSTLYPSTPLQNCPLSLWEFQMKFSGKRSERCRESVGGENGSPPIHQAIHFSEKLAPDKYYLVRITLRLMGVAASALE